VAATLLAYRPAMSAGFIWDDDSYLTGNPLLVGLAGLRRIWIPGQTPQFYPAVFTSFWIERQLWGLHPAGYHLVNIALHALDALLVWRLGRALRLPGAWFVAALFALHPVQVESVAWISERKNVLSTCFYLLAALAWLRGLERGDAARSYAAALGLFLLALLSKSVTCSLPVALLLMLLWQRRRITARRLASLLPFLLLGLLFAWNTARLERLHVGAAGPEFDFSLAERALIASRALLFYPQKLLLPWPLTFVYPRWELDASRAASYWPLAVELAVAVGAIVAWRRGARGPALALAFYAVTIFPALGFVDVYPMRYSFVADHFQYLACLGLFALAGGAAEALARRPRVAAVAGGAVLAGLGGLSWRQCRSYADAETLWRATIARNPGAWIALNNLGSLVFERGESDEAIELLQRALAAASSEAAAGDVRFNLALTLDRAGRDEEALALYLQLQESEGGMHVRIAQTLESLGRDEEAEAAYRRALSGEAREAAWIPFGQHLLRRGRADEAVEPFAAAVAAHPDDADACLLLCDACEAAGRVADAIAACERARSIARAQGDERAVLVEQRLARLRAAAPAGQ